VGLILSPLRGFYMVLLHGIGLTPDVILLSPLRGLSQYVTLNLLLIMYGLCLKSQIFINISYALRLTSYA